MDESLNLLGSGTGESRVTATLANLRRNVLDQHAATIDREHFAHELFSGSTRPADVALGHGELPIGFRH